MRDTFRPLYDPVTGQLPASYRTVTGRTGQPNRPVSGSTPSNGVGDKNRYSRYIIRTMYLLTVVARFNTGAQLNQPQYLPLAVEAMPTHPGNHSKHPLA